MRERAEAAATGRRTKRRGARASLRSVLFPAPRRLGPTTAGTWGSVASRTTELSYFSKKCKPRCKQGSSHCSNNFRGRQGAAPLGTVDEGSLGSLRRGQHAMGGFWSAPVSCRVPGTLAAWQLAARGLRGCRRPHTPDPRTCYSAALFRADKDAGVRSNRVKFKKKNK